MTIERHVNLMPQPDAAILLEAGLMRWLAWTAGRKCVFRSVSVLRNRDDQADLCFVLRFENATELAAWPTSREHEELSRQISEHLADATATNYEVLG